MKGLRGRGSVEWAGALSLDGVTCDAHSTGEGTGSPALAEGWSVGSKGGVWWQGMRGGEG